MISAPPFSHIFDLSKIGDDDVSIIISPDVAECAAIAEWLGARAVEMLEAQVMLSRKARDLYRYEARFAAAVVQACVVTLEPVHSRLEGDIRRLYQLSTGQRSREGQRSRSGAISLSDDEEPEPVETTLIDIVAPVLEELSLALDPYPRAAGVVFDTPAEPASEGDNPFAVLENLKGRLASGESRPTRDGNRGGQSGTEADATSKRRK